MHSRPKSSAEILATAKRASQKETQPRKSKTERSQPLKDRLSRLNFTRNAAISDIPPASSCSFRPANSVHGLNIIQFKDPMTPQTLEAALEIKEGRDVMVEEIPDLVGDELPTTWTSASELESPTDSISSSSSQSCRMSLSERVQDSLAILRGRRLSPFDLILEILDEDKPEYSCHRTEFYKEGNEKLTKILDAILSSGQGRSKLRTWMRRPATVNLFGDVITQEMNNVQKAELLPGIAAITPEFIKNWTISPLRELAPCLLHVLSTAAQTAVAKEKNKIKEPDMLCNVLLKQLSYQRSSNSLGFATVFGLFLWATGCARQTIDALHKCGLSICYSSVLNAISSLATQCVELAVNIGSGIHVFCYDNVNLSTSIFVEQRGSTFSPAKVNSGTFAVLYKVRNGNPEHMKLAPIIERFKSVKGLKFNLDLQPTVIQFESFLNQLKVVVTRILTKYVKGFESYSKDQALQHKPRRPIPKGYITEQFPLRATTIEEATVRGNLLFHDDIYITQLKRSTDELSEYAIPSINDQLTNARIRSGQTLRARDVNPWERREVFQLGFGLFHLCLNLVWAILHVHRGSLAESGSLTFFFALLEKTRLGCEHPDYHTLLAALTQIHDGLILNAWRMECNCKTLFEFAATRPTAEDLLNMAGTIIQRYATPMQKGDKTTAEDSDSGDEADSDTPQLMARTRRKPAVPPIVAIDAVPDPNQDRAHQNIRLLTRDLLVLAELIRAISDGDIGRVEDFLPQLAMMFRGAGSNNYCSEILHFILNLKHVWTPEFADIMRDNMLVNISGLEGHSMAIDINMEHLIGQLKELLTAKGLESTWDRLGDISAAIDYLNKIKKKVSSALSSSYQRSTHTTPDTSHLVWRVADKIRDEELQVFREKRVGNFKVKAVVDIHATGEAKLKSSSLATFNKKISAMVKGHMYEDEQDAIPQTQLLISRSDETEDNN